MKSIVTILVCIIIFCGCTPNTEKPGFSNSVENTQDHVGRTIKAHDKEVLTELESMVKQKESHKKTMESLVEPKIFDVSSNMLISLGKGESIIFSLKSNPTTGYSWDCEIDDETKLKLIDKDYITEGNAVLLGQAGRQIFKFESLSSEHSVIIFKYSRASENKAIKTFRVSISYK